MKKLYVIVRSDIPWIHQAVQAGHAVAEYMLKHPESQWKNDYLIYVRVPNEPALRNYKFLLETEWGCRPVAFFEPDMKDQMTAVAVEGGFANTLLEELSLL